MLIKYKNKILVLLYILEKTILAMQDDVGVVVIVARIACVVRNVSTTSQTHCVGVPMAR